MNTHKFWREIQQTKWHFWEERKVETPKCRKKTVTRTNEMIEDLIDFIEIHPIVAFEAIYEPMLTSFWSLIMKNKTYHTLSNKLIHLAISMREEYKL
jgi:hypothetical protein